MTDWLIDSFVTGSHSWVQSGLIIIADGESNVSLKYPFLSLPSAKLAGQSHKTMTYFSVVFCLFIFLTTLLMIWNSLTFWFLIDLAVKQQLSYYSIEMFACFNICWYFGKRHIHATGYMWISEHNLLYLKHGSQDSNLNYLNTMNHSPCPQRRYYRTITNTMNMMAIDSSCLGATKHSHR